MLVFARKPGQKILIHLSQTLSPNTPVGAIFANGPIEVMVNRIIDDEVRLGFTAHPSLFILRGELLVVN